MNNIGTNAFAALCLAGFPILVILGGFVDRYDRPPPPYTIESIQAVTDGLNADLKAITKTRWLTPEEEQDFMDRIAKRDEMVADLIVYSKKHGLPPRPWKTVITDEAKRIAKLKDIWSADFKEWSARRNVEAVSGSR